MIYVLINSNGKATLSNPAEAQALNYAGIETRNDWKTMERAEQVAAELSESLGYLCIATDAGGGVSPRYDVIMCPRVGDEVSYGFNGDTYPCGVITKISDSLRKIETSEGNTFWRRRDSGKWLYQKTWSLIRGHSTTRNPHF
jgi:hypothetical protein